MWESLKKILEDTGRAVIVEDGEAKYVLLSVDEYMILRDKKTTQAPHENILENKPQEVEIKNTPPSFSPTSARVEAGASARLHSPVDLNRGDSIDIDANDELSRMNNEDVRGSGEINLEDLPF